MNRSLREILGLLSLFVLASGLSACALFPFGISGNQPLASTIDPPVTAARLTNWRPLPNDVFVGVALSGGGSRAANFSAAVLFELEELGDDSHGGFEHLYDAGVNDNLGVRSLRLAAQKAAEEYEQAGQGGLRGCFLFVVDAQPRSAVQYPPVVRGPDPSTITVDPDPSPKGLIGYLINPNALHAADVLFQRYHAFFLRELGLNDVSGNPYQEIPLPRQLPMRLNGGLALDCAVWHIALARLMSPSLSGAAPPGSGGSPEKWQRFQSMNAEVGEPVNRISTRFQLRDSKGRAPRDLQDLLFKAARLLVREDRSRPLRAACDWFKARGFDRVWCSD